MNYIDFLENKKIIIQDSGFEIDESQLNNKLFDFQKFIVKKALKKGRYSIFADTGLGKTPMQLEFARQILLYENKSVLILAPLAVSLQTIEQGKKFDIEVEKFNGKYKNKIYISNYEQLDNIDCNRFAGIILDESSILKNFTGKLRNKIIDNFKNTKYKLACTATPSPNDLMELGNHAEFLNIMTSSEMLAMYFNHDGGSVGKWHLKKHSKKEFYHWIGQWATVIITPKDIGFDGKRYILPELKYFNYKINVSLQKNNSFFNDRIVSATNFNQQLKLTKKQRLNKVKEIIDTNKNEQIIIWVNQNGEADYLKKILKDYDYREVRGSDKIEKKEKDLIDFAHNKYKILITKSKIAGMGMNFQSCHIQIFAGLDFSFEKLYQSVRRSYRFGQKEKVYIHIVSTDTMENVIDSIREKENIFNELRMEMKNIINKTKHKEIKNYNMKDVITDNYKLLLGDCCKRIKEIKNESIGFSIFSPPFAELYVFSDKLEDMGNCRNYDDFFEHFIFLIPELYRIIQLGRLIAVHCVDLPLKKSVAGQIGFRDFSGRLIQKFIENGFVYHDRITIWKDPAVEMQRTKALGLLHKQLKKDSSMCRTGNPDYLLVFRKEGTNKVPIENKDIPVYEWQKMASPVCMDIKQSNTLNKKNARETNDEKHIRPLQLDTIQRAITLWSNKNDIVFTPFMGIGSEIYQAIKMNRRGIGIELKESYFKEAVKNVKNAELKKRMSFNI